MGSSGAWDYSTTPGNNTAAPPAGAPEGMAANLYNNTLREIMANLALLMGDFPWLDLFRAYTVSKQSDTVARIASVDVTAFTTAGRRIKITGVSTVYGTILSASFTGGNTDLTCAMDDGSSVPGTITKIEVAVEDENSRPPIEEAFPVNEAINGEFDFWTQGTSFTSATAYTNGDGNYWADDWIHLSDGADIVDITREETTVPTGSRYAARFDIETANKKFMEVKILEHAKTVRYRGEVMSFSFQARRSGSSLNPLRMAILQWTGTADEPTIDVVSAWNSAGTNPTLVAGWAYANTPASLTSMTTSFQTYTLENVSISASANNLAIAVWLDDTSTTVGDFIYFGKVRWHRGPRALELPPKSYALDELDCLRLFRTTFDRDVAPVDNAGANGALRVFCTTAMVPAIYVPLSPPMRITPSVSMFNYASSTAGQWANQSQTALAAARAIQFTPSGGGIDNTGSFAGANQQYLIHAAFDARF